MSNAMISPFALALSQLGDDNDYMVTPKSSKPSVRPFASAPPVMKRKSRTMSKVSRGNSIKMTSNRLKHFNAISASRGTGDADMGFSTASKSKRDTDNDMDDVTDGPDDESDDDESVEEYEDDDEDEETAILDLIDKKITSEELEKKFAEEEEFEKAKLRIIIANMSSEQLKRFEMVRRATFKRKDVRRIVKDACGDIPSVKVAIAISGIAKMFVCDLVEKALDIKDTHNAVDSPLKPRHLKQAFSELDRQNRVFTVRQKKFPYTSI
uniref:TAFII28 domain-containing protein n=1 Tax=Panagrellus redivivus TaxID=6233 RepID=A0A7E4ZXW8_PANRE